MCRSIRRLHHYAPPATDDEIRAACLQFVRKVSGFNKPSRTNEAAFLRALDEISASTTLLLATLSSNTAPRDRAADARAAARRGLARAARTASGASTIQGAPAATEGDESAST